MICVYFIFSVIVEAENEIHTNSKNKQVSEMLGHIYFSVYADAHIKQCSKNVNKNN